MATPLTGSRLDLVAAYRLMLTIRRFEEAALELARPRGRAGVDASRAAARGDPVRDAVRPRARGSRHRDVSRPRLGDRLRRSRSRPLIAEILPARERGSTAAAAARPTCPRPRSIASSARTRSSAPVCRSPAVSRSPRSCSAPAVSRRLVRRRRHEPGRDARGARDGGRAQAAGHLRLREQRLVGDDADSAIAPGRHRPTARAGRTVCPAFTVDGADPDAVAEAAAEAAERARRRRRPDLPRVPSVA